MNRLAIRNYARFLWDELKELPEGMIKDEDETEFDLNELINISQQNVQLDLLQIIPQYFRKKFLISREANKWEYDLVDDLSVTDFLMMEDIFHNESAKKPHGLTYIELDQLYEFVSSIDQVGEPKVWFWEEEGVIGLKPIPLSTVADRYKAYYFYKLPDLRYDDADIDEESADGDGGTTVFSFISSKVPVVVSSVTISYTVGSVDYEGTDDGLGVITGTGLTGTIDYITGAIALTFATAPDVDTTIDLAATATNKYVVPAFPAPAHKLISIDVVLQLQIADESGALEVGKIYDRELGRVRDKLLKITPSLKFDRRERLSKMVR